MSRDPHSRVRAAIGDLVAQGVLDDAQGAQVTDAVTTALDARRPEEPRARFAEVAGYVGGAVTAGATMLLIARSWDALSHGGRVTLLAAITLVLIGTAIAIGGGTPSKLRALADDEESARRRLVSTLFTLSAAAAAGAAAAAVISAADEVVSTAEGLVSGLALIALGAVWAALSRRNVFAEPYVALGAGAATALLGAQLVVLDGAYNTVAYALTAATAVACFAGFLLVRNWLVLATAVLAVVLVVPEALNDWTDGSLGGATLLLAAGVALLVASGLGLRLRDQR